MRIRKQHSHPNGFGNQCSNHRPTSNTNSKLMKYLLKGVAGDQTQRIADIFHHLRSYSWSLSDGWLGDLTVESNFPPNWPADGVEIGFTLHGLETIKIIKSSEAKLNKFWSLTWCTNWNSAVPVKFGSFYVIH